MANIKIDFTKITGEIKPLHGVGQPPMAGRNFSRFHYLTEAGVPFSRLHDVGGMFGGFRWVDVPNIFRDFDADENDPASYDFACTDESILACLETGTKTFFRLGETIEHQVVKHRVHPPKDFNKWARICERIIMHYTEGWANGYELDMPYWEIWCEPDLGPQLWTGTKEEFFDLYEITAKLLKSRFPHLKIGGPGMTGGSKNFAWAQEFLTEMEKREVPIDFFSWHRYTKTPEDTLERATRIQKMKLVIVLRNRLQVTRLVRIRPTCRQVNQHREVLSQ